MVKLSIIIPYYNTYELTDRLIRSLDAQIKDDVEIILIDDGCSEIRFDVYDENYEHISVIHKKNGGVSSARNKGLELAKGKYIAFIDSDDMVMPYYIDTLLKLIDDRTEDIIIFDWMDKHTGDIIKRPSNPAVWKAIYKKEILPMFEECYKAREDYFFQEVLNKEKHTIYYCDKVLYIYNSGRENSLTWQNERGML